MSVLDKDDGSMTWNEPFFLAEASAGLVECNNRGCRPVFRKQWAPEVTDSGRSGADGHALGSCLALDGAEIEGRATAFRQRQEMSAQSSKGRPSLPTEFAEFVNEVWVETVTAEKYFRDAMRRSPYDVRLLTSFAQFSWQRLHNKSQAEDLFQKALSESPDNSDALASYALFLWESESESEGEN
ncbi:hypothetical protein CLOM_g19394 [Closterium sp. NIES-68]|nr:hypothetical protein CLOM_g19394 [Closterium sp. NIES-68]GJP76894.1 hypothetical protein CLOP_g7341 [Closterium sp. NIES-67]